MADSTPAEDSPRHVPALLEESVHWLAPGRGGLLVDCTVGLGGHTEALLEAEPAVRVLGIDRDPRALEIAARRLSCFGDRVRFAEGRFGQLGEILRGLGIGQVEGVFADFGVSSMQLDIAERGFSFRLEGPLDMRMGSGDRTAEEIVNTYSEEALSTILRQYGEERQARRVARAIVRRRLEEPERPISSTAELGDLIARTKSSKPGRGRRRHPATQTFQALRIEVNRELEQVEELLDQATSLLATDGRLVLISYHSLEDRLVKNSLRDLATGEIEPITGRTIAETQVIEVLTKKPVRPSEEEVAANPRARSARLRAARRL
nr:ribosomal RNA small subunit methyltransferase H-like [Nerophis lumbriciformis]